MKTTKTPFDVREQFAAPRVRRELVALCRSIVGDAAVAEDLAQETFLETLRRADDLHTPEMWRFYLNGVARNVCKRWRQKRGREASRCVLLGDDPRIVESVAADPIAETEAAWEREEAAALLDKIMGLLPSDARALLVEHYAENIPQAESAARLGIPENMVAVRLHRSKRLMRRLITQDAALRTEAATHHLLDNASRDGWRETNLWCRWCGQARVVARFIEGKGDMETNCPRCNPRFLPFADATTANAAFAMPYRGKAAQAKSFRPLMKRLNQWWDGWYQRGALGEMLPCHQCGRSAARFCPAPPGLGRERTRHPVHIRCAACAAIMLATPSGIALKSAALMDFWQRHPRLRVQPEQEISFAASRPAIRIRFESLGPLTASFDVILERDSFVTLHTQEF